MLSYWHTIVRWAGPVNIYWKCKLFGTIQPLHWNSLWLVISHLNPASHWLWKVTTLSWCDGIWFVISNDNMMTWEQSTVHTDIRLTNTTINHMRIISRLLLWHGNFSKDTKLFKKFSETMGSGWCSVFTAHFIIEHLLFLTELGPTNILLFKSFFHLDLSLIFKPLEY